MGATISDAQDGPDKARWPSSPARPTPSIAPKLAINAPPGVAPARVGANRAHWLLIRVFPSPT